MASAVPRPYEEREQYDDMYDLPTGLLDENFEASIITADLVDEERLGQRAVVLHNVFSAAECKRVMDYFESLNIREKCMSRTDYRNNYRVVGRDVVLATELFRRIQGFVPATETITAENKAQYTSSGLGMDGTWEVQGLNNCFRICKYDPDGHFAPHFDSDYAASPDCRSFKTFMIYLNADYSAGETNFLHNHALYFDKETNRYKAPASAIHASVKAKPGDLLIFDHHILHEGASVVGAPKYIMRSEIMYRRQPEDDSAWTPEYRAEREKEKKAIDLFLRAQQLEANRQELEAVELYRKAFKLCPRLEYES